MNSKKKKTKLLFTTWIRSQSEEAKQWQNPNNPKKKRRLLYDDVGADPNIRVITRNVPPHSQILKNSFFHSCNSFFVFPPPSASLSHPRSLSPFDPFLHDYTTWFILPRCVPFILIWIYRSVRSSYVSASVVFLIAGNLFLCCSSGYDPLTTNRHLRLLCIRCFPFLFAVLTTKLMKFWVLINTIRTIVTIVRQMAIRINIQRTT